MKKKEALAGEARRLLNTIRKMKMCYARLDELAVILRKEEEALAKHGIAVVDNFAEKNVAYRAMGIRRWELIDTKKKRIVHSLGKDV